VSSSSAGAGTDSGFSVVGLRLRAPGRRRLAFCCLWTCSSLSGTAAASGSAAAAVGRVRPFCCPCSSVVGLWRAFCPSCFNAGLDLGLGLTNPPNLWGLSGLRRRPGALVCGVVGAGGSAGVSACGTGLLVVVVGTVLGFLGLAVVEGVGATLALRRDSSIPAARDALRSGCSLRSSNMDTLLISGAPPCADTQAAHASSSTRTDTTTSLMAG